MDGFEQCVTDARDRGEIPPDKADEILALYRAERMSNDPERAQNRTLEAWKRRVAQASLNLAARDKITKHLLNFKDARGRPDAIRAAYALFEDFGFSGSPSVRFQREALEGMSFAKIADALDHFRRKTLFRNASLVGGRQNKKQLGDLTRAMFDEAGQSPEMMEFARSLLEVSDHLRRMHNERSGDTIPYLPDWGGPQMWDQAAVNNAGGGRKDSNVARETFFRDVDPEFGWLKMRDPMTQEIFQQMPSEAKRRAIINDIWDSITSNGLNKHTPVARAVGSGSLGNARSDHRYVYFKDADAKMRVMRKYGMGDSLSQTIHHIKSMSTDIALMEFFGPNAAGNLEWLKQTLLDEAEKRHAKRPGETNLLPTYDQDKAINAAKQAGKVLDGYYEQFRGDGVTQGGMALLGTILQNNAYGSLLGSAVIQHMTTNWLIQTHGRMLAGIPAWNTVPQLIHAIFSKATGEEMLTGRTQPSGRGDDRIPVRSIADQAGKTRQVVAMVA